MIPKELEKFYKSLEKTRFLNSWNIRKELDYSDDIDGEWQNKLIAERKLLTYDINNGKLLSSFTTIDIEGKTIPIEYSKEEIDYFKQRIEQTTNKWLIAKYAHIIWQNTKHNDYAEIALSTYLENIKRLTQDEKHQLPEMLSAILHISKKTKKKKEDIKKLVLGFIENNPVGLKYRILKTAIDFELFNNGELKILSHKIPTWVSDNLTSYFINKSLLNLGINLYHKLGIDKSLLYEQLAINEEIILKEHPEDADFVKFQTLGTIAQYLSLAGKKQESEKYYREYNRLKQTVELGKIRTQLEDKEQEMFNDYLNKLSEAILKSDANGILSYFSVHPDVLVDPEEINKFTEQNIKQSLSSLFSTTVFDINSNFKQLEDSDKFSNEWIKSYAISHAIRCEALFLKTFVNGILRGKLDYQKIYIYLKEETWFGLKFQRRMTKSEIDNQASWLSMIAPGIHNLFAQFEMSVLLNNNKINNFILAIDSLTLKFEGALRDFILLSGGNTTKSKDGELKEQLLEDLLNNPTIIEYFGDRDLEFFKYTFTNKGRNIRNNVAHSFFQFSDYSLQTAILVFLCLLRLGKYTFNEKTSS